MPSRFFKINSIVIVFLLILGACKKDKNPQEPDYPLTPYTLSYPSYFPSLNNLPSDNPLTKEGINLGKKLYYDPILSNTGNSCSSCHNQVNSFSSYSANSLPHVNLAWNTYFLWNGKVAGTVEDIMRFEVEQFFQTDLNKLNASTEYKTEFKKVFKVEDITSKEVAYAMAQFVRSLISCNSKFDRFAQHQVDLTESEMRGFILFTTEKGDCFHCHSIGLFTDNKFHNIGLDSSFSGTNMGRYNITGNSFDIGQFKSPTLRNIALTAPYMHDGRFQTLEEVVEHYNSDVKLSTTIDPIMTKANKEFGLLLSAQDKADLVAFLNTLTDTVFRDNPDFEKP